jgi:hypothetical protein
MTNKVVVNWRLKTRSMEACFDLCQSILETPKRGMHIPPGQMAGTLNLKDPVV